MSAVAVFALWVGIPEPLKRAEAFAPLKPWSSGSGLALRVQSSFDTLPEGRIQCAYLLCHFQQLLCIPGKCTACAFLSG